MEPFEHLLRAPGYEQPHLKLLIPALMTLALTVPEVTKRAPWPQDPRWPREGCRHKRESLTGHVRSLHFLDFARQKHHVVSPRLGGDNENQKTFMLDQGQIYSIACVCRITKGFCREVRGGGRRPHSGGTSKGGADGEAGSHALPQTTIMKVCVHHRLHY